MARETKYLKAVILTFIGSCWGSAQAAPGQIFLRDFMLDSADGSRGYVIEHPLPNQTFPKDLSPIGDINQDGYNDFAVSNDLVRAPFEPTTGEVFIFFGGPGAPPRFDSVLLRPEFGGDGSGGFVIRTSEENTDFGWAISNVGDINSDGIDDIGIGSPAWLVGPGFVHVVFGRAANDPFPAALDVSELAVDSDWGLVFIGDNFGRTTGFEVRGLGDVNGDSIDDFAIGTQGAEFFPGTNLGTGRTYVVYGRAQGNPFPFAQILISDWLPENGNTGELGFVLVNSDSRSGLQRMIPIDINGDGFMDIVQDVNGPQNLEMFYTFVIYGRPTAQWPVLFDVAQLLPENNPDGSQGFAIFGSGPTYCSHSNSVADLDNDGIEDLILGCFVRELADRGRVYVLWGRATQFQPLIQTSAFLPENGGDGSLGITIEGTARSTTGFSQFNGDVNSDGIDDLLLRSNYLVVPGDVRSRITQDVVYIVFGRQGKTAWATVLTLDLFAENSLVLEDIGVAIRGEPVPYIEPPLILREFAGGQPAIVPDINGDGHNDILLGTIFGVSSPPFNSKVYVLYGGPKHLPLPTAGPNTMVVPVLNRTAFLVLATLLLFMGLRQLRRLRGL